MNNKVWSFQIASTLANGVMTNFPEIEADYNDTLKAQVAIGWEVFRTYQHAASTALGSNEWPTPEGLVNDFESRLPGLLGAFTGNPAIQEILKQLLAKM